MNRIGLFLVVAVASTLVYAQGYYPDSPGPGYHPSLSWLQPQVSVKQNATARNALGDFGEWLGRESLEYDGQKVWLAYKRGGNQGIDIIARKGTKLSIIEVKTRHNAWATVGSDQLTEAGIRNRAQQMANPGSHFRARHAGRAILNHLDSGRPVEYKAIKINIGENAIRWDSLVDGQWVKGEPQRLNRLLRSIEKNHPQRLVRGVAKLHRLLFAGDRVFTRGRLLKPLGNIIVNANRVTAAALVKAGFESRRGALLFLHHALLAKLGPLLVLGYEAYTFGSYSYDGGLLYAGQRYAVELVKPFGETWNMWAEVFLGGVHPDSVYRAALASGSGLAMGLGTAYIVGYAGFQFGLMFGSASIVTAPLFAILGGAWGFLVGYREGFELGRAVSEKFFTETVSEEVRERANNWMLQTRFETVYPTLD